MSDVLRTVHRLRKVEEHRAQAQLATTEAGRAAAAQRLATTESALSANHEHAAASGKVLDLASHHALALRRELQRRAEARELARRDQEAGRARNALTAARTAARVVELVADDRDARTSAERLRQANAAFDEQGLQAWWRTCA